MIHSILVSLFFLTLATFCTAILLPPPAGPYDVEIRSQQLTDYSRPNPWASNPPYRSLMISTFTAVDCKEECSNISIPYMPKLVAKYYDQLYSAYGIPKDTFASISIPSANPQTNNTDTVDTQSPLLLFSPGLGDSRLIYSALASNIASYGFEVVTIDHPYDAPIVEFPDGSTITATNISSNSSIVKALAVRSDDVSFLVSEYLHSDTLGLQNASEHAKRPIVVAGHSLGGATAVECLIEVPQLHAAINLDGTLWGLATRNTTTIAKPVLLFGHENKTDPSWASIWPRLLRSKVKVNLDGSQHASFTDLPYLVQVLGFSHELPPAVHQLLGSISGRKAQASVTGVVNAWFGINSDPWSCGDVGKVRQVARQDHDLDILRWSTAETHRHSTL